MYRNILLPKRHCLPEGILPCLVCKGIAAKRSFLLTLPNRPPSNPPLAAIPQRNSLVNQTAESVRAHLQAGHWAQGLPAERELCQHLQVSRPTVRAALQDLERQGLIKLTGRTRRPTPDTPGSGTRGTNTRVVTILTPRPLHAMSHTSLFVIDTLREMLAKTGYLVDLHSDPVCFSSSPARALEKLVEARPIATWVAWGSKEPMQQWFVQHHLPLLVLGSCRAEIPLSSIDLDFHATCRHAADLLWRRGHRRLALVLQQDAYGGDLDSEEGFREGLNQHPEAQLHEIRHDGTPAHLCALLDRTLRLPSPPTGYLVIRAPHALTVATHLMRRNLSLPKDAAVLSRDDEGYLQHTSPALSRYALDPNYLARKVCKIVRELAERGSLIPKAIRLIPKLIAGETV